MSNFIVLIYECIKNFNRRINLKLQLTIMRTLSIFTFLLIFLGNSYAQDTQSSLEIYAFEEGNRGFLNQVEIIVTAVSNGQVIVKGYTDIDGIYRCDLPKDQEFIVKCSKNAFQEDIQTIKTSETQNYLQVKMTRKPGYLFEATLAPTRESDEPVDAILGAKIEIYNNTKKRQELTLEEHDFYTFTHRLEPGNHYTMLIRKKGFYNKRIEAYVDIEGCILCFEGTGEIQPGVVDNLTDGLTKGSLLTNIEMKPIEIGKGIEIKDIYYDYDKAYIRKDAKPILDNLITLLKNNPALIVEMGSHTDSRGKDEYNRELSERRAKAVVEYLTKSGDIRPERLSAWGYGETQLVNKCGNGVSCSVAQHQKNRRTEMKVVGILDYDPYVSLSLKEIISKEQNEQYAEEVKEGKTEKIKVNSFEDLPEEVKRDILRSQGKLVEENNKPEKEKRVSEPAPSHVNMDRTEEDKAEKEASAEEASQAQALRFIPFPTEKEGYTVQLGKLKGSKVEIEKSLMDRHGKIYKQNGDYFLGIFESKRLAKKFKNSISKIYPDAEVVELP